MEGVNGHDRIVKAYQENLEGGRPLPVFITDHRDAEDKRVKVSQTRPIVLEEQEYIVISIPTSPAPHLLERRRSWRVGK